MSTSPVLSATKPKVARVSPALERRTMLRERRPRTLRRHTTRVATRFAVLLSGDLVAIVLARFVAIWASDGSATVGDALAHSPLITGGRRLVFLGIATLIAVFVNGGHSRHRALNQPNRLFVAAAAACLLNWNPIIARRGFFAI